MARKVLLSLALLLTAGLSGCLGGPGDDAGGAGPNVVFEVEEDTELDLHLTPSLGLATKAPTADDPVPVTIPSFYDEWVTGGSWPDWERTMDRDLRITRATLSFHYQSEGTTATTGPADQGFPEFVAYVGVAGSYMAWASIQGGDVAMAGEPQKVEAELELPWNGLFVQAGDPLSVLIVPVQGSSGEGDRIQIITNSTEHPSVLTIDPEPWRLQRPTWERLPTEEVLLVGSAYVAEEEGLSSTDVTFEVPNDAIGVRAHLARTDGAGGADLDIELVNPRGDVVAVGVTPRPVEDVRLLDANLENGVPGAWTATVTQYGGVYAEAEVTIWIGRAPAPGI